MEIIPQLFTARVMHKRLFPKVNQFTYGIYYLALPLSKLSDTELKKSLPINRSGLLSFRTRDYGPRKNNSSPQDLENWIREILASRNLDAEIKNIVLISMPRVLGYGFNPVSFWMCFDTENKLRAILCEVNNTFGETHSYLCVNKDLSPIKEDDWLTSEKLFHVSPFIAREGSYKFRFSLNQDKLAIWINYHDENDNKQLVTSLIGSLAPLTKKSLRNAFWKHPLVTLKTIALIHWQALKLFSKGIKYNDKPEQKNQRIT